MIEKSIRRVTSVIDGISKKVGNVVCYLIPLIGLILIWEVVSRYVLGAPTNWGHEVSQHAFGIMFILGGAYALWLGAHVNVDIILRRFSPRTQAIVNSITFLFFALFFIVLIESSIPIAVGSWERLERTMSPWGAPYYPLKTAVPIGALLILLQGIAKFLRDAHHAVTGREVTIN